MTTTTPEELQLYTLPETPVLLSHATVYARRRYEDWLTVFDADPLDESRPLLWHELDEAEMRIHVLAVARELRDLLRPGSYDLAVRRLVGLLAPSEVQDGWALVLGASGWALLHWRSRSSKIPVPAHPDITDARGALVQALTFLEDAPLPAPPSTSKGDSDV